MRAPVHLSEETLFGFLTSTRLPVVSSLSLVIRWASLALAVAASAYGVGCLAAMGLEKWQGRVFIGKKLVPFAAGLIVGEALTQLAWSIFRMATGGG